jgi:hypothetical protein
MLPGSGDDHIQTCGQAGITIRDPCSPPLVSMTTSEQLSGKRYAVEVASSVYN